MQKDINKTHLNKKILDHFTSARQEHPDGKNSLPVLNEELQHILKESIQNRDFDSEAIFMVKLIKKEVF